MTETAPTPLRVLSLGAGVQSSTLLLMSLAGDIPKYDHVIYADTLWEPAAVYDQVNHLEELATAAGIGFHRVSAGDIRKDLLEETGRPFANVPLHVVGPNGRPGMLRRQCSYHYKMRPVLIKLREVVGLRRYERSKHVLAECHLGISLDEVERMRPAELAWVLNVYPLVDLRMTRQDCITWCTEHGHKEPPRSSCLGCPLKGGADWERLRTENPEEWQDVVEFDAALRNPETRIGKKLNRPAYVHRSLRPMDQTEQPGQDSLFGEECTGFCAT